MRRYWIYKARDGMWRLVDIGNNQNFIAGKSLVSFYTGEAALKYFKGCVHRTVAAKYAMAIAEAERDAAL